MVHEVTLLRGHCDLLLHFLTRFSKFFVLGLSFETCLAKVSVGFRVIIPVFSERLAGIVIVLNRVGVAKLVDSDTCFDSF